MCIRNSATFAVIPLGLISDRFFSVFLRPFQGFKKVLEMSLFACLYFDSDKSVSILNVNCEDLKASELHVK